MFGVTTSDDYRPVAWMGRYPVDVTTMLVGVHVAVRFSPRCIVTQLPVWLACSSYFIQFDSAAIWYGLAGLAAWYLCVRSFPAISLLWFAIEMYLLFVFGREVERFLGRRAYIALYVLYCSRLPTLLTIWGLLERSAHCRFDSVALWNFCCVCDHLSARRIVATDPS